MDKIKKKLFQFRLDRLLFYYIPFFIGTLQYNYSIEHHIMLFVLFFILFELMIILNDYVDTEVDHYNQRNRPFLKERYFDLIVFIPIFFILLFFIHYTIQPDPLFYFGMNSSLFLSLLYHVKPLYLKGIFPLNNICLGLIAGFLYMWGSNGHFQMDYFILIVIYFGIGSVYKDFKDIYGDKKCNIITFPVIIQNAKLGLKYGYFTLAFFFWLFNSFVFYRYHFVMDVYYYLLYVINILLFFANKEKYYFPLLVINSFLIYFLLKN